MERALTVNYSNQTLNLDQKRPSIFLMGPTARRDHRLPAQEGDPSTWRPDALAKLTKAGFRGIVYVPEHSNGNNPDFVLDNQIDWEVAAIAHASVVALWLPRQIDRSRPDLGMPGFTTNVEFGYELAKKPDRFVYGRPPDADKTRYLDERFRRETDREPFTALPDTMQAAAKLAVRLHQAQQAA